MFERFRTKRYAFYNRTFGAAALCAAGLLIMPALLFNPAPLYRAAQCLGFWFLCWLAGKRNNSLVTITVIVTIIAFNLIIPYGKVLFVIGAFKITEGALMTGVQRAATLEGLIMLSRLAIRKDLRIPGTFGQIIGESFSIFTKITESRPRITRKSLLGDIDTLLLDLSECRTIDANSATAASKKGPAGFVILAAVILLSWLPLIIYYFPNLLTN